MITMEEFIKSRLDSGKDVDQIVAEFKTKVTKEEAKQEQEKKNKEEIEKKRYKAAAAVIEYLYATGEVKDYKPSDIQSLADMFEKTETSSFNNDISTLFKYFRFF